MDRFPMGLTVLALALASTAGGAPALPHAEGAVPLVRFEGAPLNRVLASLSGQFKVPLAAGRSLERQRVTLYAKNASLTEIAQGLADLLGVGPEAPVLWLRDGEGWRLEESANRRAFARRVREERAMSFLALIEERIAWARGPGAEEWARNPAEPRRFLLLKELVQAHLLDALGPDGRAALLAGRPMTFRIGALPERLRELCRERIVRQSGLRDAPPEEVDQYAYVLLYGRDPISPRGDHLWLTVVVPGGVMGARFGEFYHSNRSLHPTSPGALDFFPRAPGDASEKITFEPAREPGLQRGEFVRRNLDAILTAIARDAGYRLFADGYIRPQALVPANKPFTDLPIDSALQFIGHLWATSHRITVPPAGRTLFVRARYWPLEDEADVAEEIVAEMTRRLGPGKKAALDDLAFLADLSLAQTHKLIESGLCPAAEGMVRPQWYEDGSSLRPWLRFYRRLGPAQQQAARTGGLALRDVPPALVREHLTVAIVAGHGVIDPERWGEIRMRIEPGSEEGVHVFHFDLPGGVQRSLRIRPSAGRPG